MAKFKLTNIAELGIEDLHKKLAELEKQLLRERGQIAKGASLDNPSKVREIRKNIARIKHQLKVKGQ